LAVRFPFPFLNVATPPAHSSSRDGTRPMAFLGVGRGEQGGTDSQLECKKRWPHKRAVACARVQQRGRGLVEERSLTTSNIFLPFSLADTGGSAGTRKQAAQAASCQLACGGSCSGNR
jgi:hypothetical protein